MTSAGDPFGQGLTRKDRSDVLIPRRGHDDGNEHALDQ